MKKNHQPKLILASASPRRADLLGKAGIFFKILPSDIPEEISPGESPRDFVLRLALEKALFQAKKITHENVFVLGADTIVCLKNRILGKPRDSEEAVLFLKALSGETHEVMTGYSIVRSPDIIVCREAAVSKVTMKKISDEEITQYVATGEPLDKAGAYAAQGIGRTLIERVEGSFSNVVGLPMEDLLPWFVKIGVAKSSINS